MTITPTSYYSAKVLNADPQPQRVKVYYESAYPSAKTEIVEETIQPRSHHLFAPRTFRHAELGEQKYTVSKLELAPPTTTEIIETETVEPVVYETKHHFKHHHRHHHRHRHSPDTPVVVEEPLVLQIHRTDGAYALSPFDESAANDGHAYTEEVIIS